VFAYGLECHVAGWITSACVCVRVCVYVCVCSGGRGEEGL